jgi:hypothetical protein
MPVLPILPQKQEDPRWCWATAASMVSTFYAQITPEPPHTPCEVASLTLGQQCCSSHPPPLVCQRQANLQNALALIRHFNPAPARNNFAVVVNEISGARPLCAAIQFFQGTLHYVVLTGFDSTTVQVAFIDPFDGVLHTIPYAQFLRNAASMWAGWILTR